MRLVLDTNVVIAGLLWSGPPRKLLDAAIAGNIEVLVTAALVTELRGALGYPKFEKRLAANGTTIEATVHCYLGIASLVAPAVIRPSVPTDSDDDVVLACALGAGADLIVSGDADLLNLKDFHRIPIVTATEALRRTIR
jgi:putative PIN family toxin of toxin-antitoxin system